MSSHECYAISMISHPQIEAALRLPSGLVLVEPIGAGGMGEVWRAHDPVLQRDVAVKVLHPPHIDDDPDSTDRFVRSRREARACARVVHPNVVAVHGIGEIAARPFIAMEWIDGLSMRQFIDDKTKLSNRALRAWIDAICNAVAHAHDRGVIHCDIKPENILLQRGTGPMLRPKLVDFGLARGANLMHRRATQQRGTQAYLAPEAGLVRPTPAVDQFALAITFVELLCGRRPSWSRGKWQFARTPRLSGPVISVLKRSLAYKTTERYPDVITLRDELLAALGPDPRPQAPAHTSSLAGFKEGDCVDLAWLAGLPIGQLRQVALAIVAMAPSGFEEALQRIAPLPQIKEVMAELAAQGLVEGGLGGWAVREPELRGPLLDQLAGPVRRGVARAVAESLAASAGRRDWMRDAAMRLYVAAGDLDGAARMARDTAQFAVTATQRDQRLAEAVALTASPDRRRPWLEALLLRLQWLVDCGWFTTAKAVLADAQAVASELQLPTDHLAAVRLTTADTSLQLLRGDTARALHKATQLPSSMAQHPARQRATAVRIRALVEGGQLQQANQTVDQMTGLDTPTAPPVLLAARAAVRKQQGKHNLAVNDLRRALAGYLDEANPLESAATAIELAELLLVAGRVEESLLIADDAEDLLESLGPVRWRGRLMALHSAHMLARNQPFAAMRHIAGALVIARENATRVDEKAMLLSLCQVCSTVDDTAGLVAAQEQLRLL